jgi:hypothetical protein
MKQNQFTLFTCFVFLSLILNISCNKDSETVLTFEKEKQIAHDAIAEYSELVKTYDSTTSLVKLIDFIKNNASVTEVTLNPDTTSIFWKLSNGMRCFYSIYYYQTDGDTSEFGFKSQGTKLHSNNFYKLNLKSSIRNNKALILSPYRWDFYPFDAGRYIKGKINGLDYTIDYKENNNKSDQNLTLEDYKNFNNYGVIYISTHGNVDFSNNNEIELATGIVLTEELRTQYEADFTANRMGTGYIAHSDDPYLCLYSSWFDQQYPVKFDSSVFYASFCYSLYNETLSDALVNDNCCYFGWNRSPGAYASYWTDKEFFKYTCDDKLNCQEAYNLLRNDGFGFSPLFSSNPVAFFSYLGDGQLNMSIKPLYVSANQNGGQFIDIINDVNKPFVDLVSINIEIDDSFININLGLNDIPQTLTFYQNELPINALNYDWSINFDLDNSNSISPGDMAISVSKWKSANSTPITTNDILGITQENVWLTENGSSFLNQCSLYQYVSLSDNEIIFSIPKSIHSSLTSIKHDSKIYFRAYFNDGMNMYIDYYPDR